LFIHTSSHTFTHPPTHPPTHLPTYLLTCLSVHPSIHTFIHKSILHPFIYPSWRYFLSLRSLKGLLSFRIFREAGKMYVYVYQKAIS
jgi:hypothetical protein